MRLISDSGARTISITVFFLTVKTTAALAIATINGRRCRARLWPEEALGLANYKAAATDPKRPVGTICKSFQISVVGDPC